MLARGRLRAMLQKRDRTPANAAFQELQRGQLVWLQDAEITPERVLLSKESTVRISEP